MSPAKPPSRNVARAHPVLTALAIAAVLIVLLISFWDWNWFKGPVERAVAANTGRAFHIDGNLDVDLGRITTIGADRLRLANADWARKTAPEMATAQRLEIDVALGQLLFQRSLFLPAIRITQPVLELESRPASQGGGNWVFHSDTAEDDQGGMQTRFGAVVVERGRLHYLDAANKTDLQIQASSGKPNAQYRAPPIDLTGAGRWSENPFTLGGRIQSPLDLANSQRPYRVDLHAAAGDTKARARGTLIDPLHLRQFNLHLALSGQNLADLYRLIGVALPESPPYAIDGDLTRDGHTWRYQHFAGKVGDSDLAGSTTVILGRPRLKLQADLVSERLDLDDLAGFIGAPPEGGAGETRNAAQEARAARLAADPRVLPQDPYDLSKLRAMDADVRLQAGRINTRLPIDDMDAHLLLNDGLLQLQPLDFGVAGGKIRSNIGMDARAPTIRTRADIQMHTLDLGRLFPQAQIAQAATGRIGGHVRVDTTGNSIAHMAGNANGEVAVGMGKGQIPQLLVELAGLDVTQSLGYLFNQDKQVPIRCAFADFGVTNGLMQTRSMAFDTTDTIVLGSGQINLKDESLALELNPRPKDRSILSFRTPLKIGGTLKDPSFHPDPGKLGLRGAVALALGAIAPPAALLATIDTGAGQDSDCGGKYAK